MVVDRGQFSSKFGFIMAAAGAAVGLGNIWGFPTQVASNGGAAFVLVYLVLAFCLAYPALMAELIVGRATRRNAVEALPMLTEVPLLKLGGKLVGIAGLITVAVILSFYAIVAGWMFASALEPVLSTLGLVESAQWVTQFGLSRNVVFTVVFMVATIMIICGGVREGIERWSTRLMPALVVILLLLIAYMMTLPGAIKGLEVYLVPDFSQILDGGLLVSALGQAFFSLSLGVGCMLIYGSYMSSRENIVQVGAWVTLIDVGLAFVAGLLIIPAMYVAQHYGVEIFDQNGQLIGGDSLIFKVLPSLFDQMGTIGVFVAFAFFTLMSLAALTSSISLLEVPVAYVVESHGVERKKASWSIGALITSLSLIIVFNFEALFGLVIAITTRYSQPILGIFFCVYAGWVWQRNNALTEIKKGNSGAQHSLFWAIWPWYVRFVCPVFILAMFIHSLN
ncbi:MAG: sodium-dependent transporter [Gammaproteobacteria bacterium]|nr:sodium-dependent transporter [Gammaproteobacteria bacterium]